MGTVQNTIEYLKTCQAARAAGYPVYLTTDPEWLLDVAVCRRGGYLDDPHFFAVAQPVKGKMPRKAQGNEQSHLRQLADRINAPRLIVRPQELGSWRKWLEARIPERFTRPEDE